MESRSALQTAKLCYDNESSSGVISTPERGTTGLAACREDNTLNPATIYAGRVSDTEADVERFVQGRLTFADVVELEMAETDDNPTYRTFEVMRTTLLQMRATGELEQLNSYLRKNAAVRGTKAWDFSLDAHIDAFARRYAFIWSKRQNRADTGKHRAAVLLRSNGDCEVCGLWCSEVMHLHHVWPVAKGGASLPQNLIGLCPNCHAFAHRLRESTDGPKERVLCGQVADYAGTEAAHLLTAVAASSVILENDAWRRTRNQDEYLQTAYEALKDSLCVTYESFKQRSVSLR